MTKHVEPKTVPYSETLFSAVMEHQIEYIQIGETVCGAEDPAVIYLGDSFGTEHPEYSGFTVCRVIDRYVSPWKSDTFLEFSTREISSDEYQQADDFGSADDDTHNHVYPDRTLEDTSTEFVCECGETVQYW